MELTKEQKFKFRLRLEQEQAQQQPEKGMIRGAAEAVIDSPALPIIGSVAGGLAGMGAASIPLAGLGAAGGESFRQLGARAMGMEVPQTSGGALKKIGIQGAIGTAGEAGGQLAMKALAPIVRPIAGAVGKGMASLGQKLIGIPDESIAAVFKKPLAMFTAPTKKTVAEAYAKSEFPQMAKSLDETLESGVSSSGSRVKRGARAVREWVEGSSEKPQQILEGRKALDKQVAGLDVQIDAAKGGAKSSLLQDKAAKLEVRKIFNRVLDQTSPKLRAADAVASKNLEVAPFREMMLPGKMNFTSPEGILRAVPGVPPVVGAAISVAGGAKKLIANKVTGKLAAQAGANISNPVITPAVANLITKYLSKDEIKKMFKQAKKENPDMSDEDIRNKLRKEASKKYTWDGKE